MTYSPRTAARFTHAAARTVQQQLPRSRAA